MLDNIQHIYLISVFVQKWLDNIVNRVQVAYMRYFLFITDILKLKAWQLYKSNSVSFE